MKSFRTPFGFWTLFRVGFLAYKTVHNLFLG